MPTRILPPPLYILTLILLCCCGNSCRAETDAAPERASISYPPYLLDADTIKANGAAREVQAEGNVEFHAPEGDFTADSVRYNTATRSGRLEGARGQFDRFYFRAQTLTLEPNQSKRVENVSLTTCVEPHPHYRLLARELVVTPDNRYTARHLTLEYAGRRLFTVPRIRGNLGGGQTTGGRPALIFGSTGIDGAYLGTEYRYPLSSSADAALSARLGTQKMLRGSLTVAQRFDVPHFYGGILAIKYSQREEASNRIKMFDPHDSARLEELTISRLPVLQVDLDAIPLPGSLRGCSVRVGAGAGRFREEPTGVAANRAQYWGVLRSPALQVGSARLIGEVGMQHAFSRGGAHRLSVALLTLQSPPNANIYYQITYAQRDEHGVTPFLFDRIIIPRELYIESELPIVGSWRLGVRNRFDLEKRNSRALGLMAIYHQDCLSYGLTYNTVDKGISFGVVVNAFGSFRKRAGAISFTE